MRGGASGWQIRRSRRRFLRASGLVVASLLVGCQHLATTTTRSTPAPTGIARPTGGATPGTRVILRRPFRNRVGWAYTAVPFVEAAEMARDFQRMKALGANIVYLGHNVGGDVGVNKWEPGLSYAVYAAMAQQTAEAPAARAMYAAIVAAIEAARSVDLDVVLPVGYQIQMGPDWNARYPEHLRRNPDGSLLLNWDFLPSASPYSPQYRADITAFYEWVDRELVRRYPNIVALNLADEPVGTDFSPWAQAVFQERYGGSMLSAPPVQLGAFLGEFLADYATWSAETWQRLNPSIWTMMTFHIERSAPWLPNLEALFQRPPSNFVFSADTHLHDVLPDQPLTAQDINLLYGMTRTFGWLSRVYQRPLMLWTAANAWGLAAESSNKGSIEDAVHNVAIVSDIPRQNGGLLAMIMAWGWNIRPQGIYRDEGHLAYLDREALLRAVATALAARRDQLSTPGTGRPERVLFVPAERIQYHLGSERVTQQARPLVDLTSFDFTQHNIIYLSEGHALEEARNAGATIVPIH